MHLLSKSFRMHYTAVFDSCNLAFIGANVLLGAITLNEINIVIGAVGAVVTLVANIDKVAYSIVRVLELKRNGWKIPKPEQSDKTEQQ